MGFMRWGASVIDSDGVVWDGFLKGFACIANWLNLLEVSVKVSPNCDLKRSEMFEFDISLRYIFGICVFNKINAVNDCKNLLKYGSSTHWKHVQNSNTNYADVFQKSTSKHSPYKFEYWYVPIGDEQSNEFSAVIVRRSRIFVTSRNFFHRDTVRRKTASQTTTV